MSNDTYVSSMANAVAKLRANCVDDFDHILIAPPLIYGDKVQFMIATGLCGKPGMLTAITLEDSGASGYKSVPHECLDLRGQFVSEIIRQKAFHIIENFDCEKAFAIAMADRFPSSKSKLIASNVIAEHEARK